jgi:hypothetical protein
MLPILFNTLLFALCCPLVLAIPQPTSSNPPASTTPESSPTHTLSEIDKHKYFHEPGGHEPGEDDRLGHYDTRYFHGLVSLEERTETLSHMTRAYLTTFRKLGLETWIAHGTLLGWWWNGKVSMTKPRLRTLRLLKPDFTLGLGRRYTSLWRYTRIYGQTSQPHHT